uniref:HEAT repeat-containing protein 5A n=1 Tax=Cacopsylla melanoneura TaxID=428564 RepID=A0A8D8UIW2_9HEMI
MELSHSLTLNEEALLQIPEAQRPMFIFEWLRFLDKVLVAAQKSDIKGCQKKLVQQLTDLIEKSQGPPTRKLIASCLSTLFSVGDTFLLFDTVNKCNDILKNRDDSPSLVNTKLAAMCCVGSMYEKLGRMMGRSYEETVHILIKSLKSADSQTRIAIMQTLEKICSGMGSAISNVHKDIYKACRYCLTDRVMSVRCATAKCLLEMVKHATFLHNNEMESLATLCFRALDGSNYDVRLCIAKLLGALIATTQHQPKGNAPLVSQPSNKNIKTTTLEEALGILQTGFLKGGVGFLKGTGEIIKGTAGVNREVRVGVTHAYVEFIKIVGGPWLERNLSAVLNHILELVANPKVATSHVDAVYSRKCVSFILRSVLGKLLSEKAQTSALKEITLIVTKHLAAMDVSSDSKDYHQETAFSQHLLVCALQEMSTLILGLGTTANNGLNEKSCNLLETVMISLIHPSQAVRLASAWCLRCICVAVPSQCTPLIDRCVNSVELMKNSPEAISGYSYALAAVLGGVKLSCLGIPHTKGKVIFNTAEELLRSANQNSRLSLHRTQAGWLLIGAIITLGVPVVRKLMPRMLLLWRNSFPQSKEKLDSEKERGEAFTWQVTLEGRAGALSAMYSFAYHCPELLTPDHTRRLLVPISKAIEMMASIGSVLKTYGQNLKAPAAMVRLRLYETLSLLSNQCFEDCVTGSYRSNLLALLVSELTLGENPANTTTSHVKTFCHSGESVLLGSGLQETDHRIIEDQLQTVNSVAGSGALEHDICCLYRALPEGDTIPGPLPLGIAVVDASVILFGFLFPKISNKHRLKILDCFADYIKHAKSARADAVTTNVFAALLCSLKNVNEVKANIGQEDVKKAATSLILGTLGSHTASLRCAAGEALGRLAQAVGDARFTAELAQNSFDRLKSARDVTSRTGHSLALGCLHRYVGGMGSSQHLNTSVSILLALAQDPTSPVVQVWSLHALSLIADSGGPMFRGYVENALSLAIKLLLTVPQSFVDVHQCIGKVLSALITTVGPELQGNSRSISMARSSFLCACTMMQDHDDPSVQAEAISCLQQLHLFAPRHVNLSSLVPTLCRTLSSSHLLLRKAAVSCLRQLTQREAKEVCEHALTLIEEQKDYSEEENTLVMTETGLPGMLFNMLNTETDSKLIKYTHDTLISMLHMLAADNLSPWLSLIKSVLTVASDASLTEDSLNSGAPSTAQFSHLTEDDEHDDADDDQSEFHTEEKAHVNIMPRWPTRVFAAECVRKIIAVCVQTGNMAHFDLALARELVASKNKSDYLVLHLSELIRMAFMAATSDSDPLRLEGLHTLKDIIDRFSGIPEPEFPGHLLLEQYQAQVGAALRPAFSPDTASHVTAAACKVCSSWIGSGVARDLNDLRRVHQLLVSSLVKLSGPHRGNPIYNESLTTLETLSILKAWAEVYVVAMTNNGHSLVLNSTDSTNNNINTTRPNDNDRDSQDDDFGNFESPSNNLLSLVQPELKTLACHWLNVLRDYALLSLPPEFGSQLPHEGGAFYTSDTMDSCRSYYSETWPAVLHATSLWLNNEGKYFNVEASERKTTDTETFHLLFGICMEAMCNSQILDNSDIIVTSLKALYTLLDSVGARQILTSNKSLPIELCNVVHRLILTKDNGCVQEIAMKVIKQIVQAVQEDLDTLKKKKLRELAPANQEQLVSEEIELLGEGGSNGSLKPGESIVFSLLEVCLCIVVRRLPALNPTPLVSPIFNKSLVQNEESGHVILATAIQVMQMLPRLCSPQGAVSILPTLLYLLTGIIKETATKTSHDPTVLATKPSVTAALHALKTLCGFHTAMTFQVKQQWNSLLQSALAKMIDLAKTVAGDNETKTDEVTMMLALAVFILHVPSEVIAAPNLQYPCINHFRQCVQSDNIQVRIKCVQTLRTLFTHSDPCVSNGYIHSLAPRIVQYLYATERTSIDSELKLQFVLELIYTAETLVKLSQPKNRGHTFQGTQMLSILVPILIKFLIDRTDSSYVNKHARALHEQSIQILMKVGPLYPQEFKSLMSECPDLRIKLEAAIKSNNVSNQQRQNANNRTANVTTAPTIKLKTNFANFN